MKRIMTFLGLTVGVSLLGFVGIATIPGAETPEQPAGLPVWMLAAWAPSLAAIILAIRSGELRALLRRVVQLKGVGAFAWCASLAPSLFFVGAFWSGGSPDMTLPGAGMVVGVVLLNLVLGPLGEELGWRGYLQAAIEERTGWVWASLIVGAVWFIWHLPLWLVESPQRSIPIPIFGGHVFAYALALGAIQRRAGASITPAIVFHLVVNVTAGLAILSGFGDAADWYRATLIPYWCLALMLVGITAASQSEEVEP